MAAPVDTAADGEGSTSKISTLKEIISNEFKDDSVSNNIYLKLVEMEIEEIEILILTDDDDLNDLCKDMDLRGATKIKFKALIRKQKKLYEPQQRQHIVTISKKEQFEINKIDLALKRSNSIHHVFESHLTEIEHHTKYIKCTVNQEFERIFKALKNREKIIINKIDEWKLNKLETVNNETSNIIKYNDKLKKIKNEIYDLLSKDRSVIQQREKNIQEITQKLYKENEYHQILNIDIKILEKYIKEKTKLLHIVYPQKILMNKLDTFGQIDIDKVNEKYSIPSIELSDIKKITEDNNGYKIKMKWKLTAKQHDDDKEEKKSDFMVQYIESDALNIDNDDEKKEFDVKNEVNDDWNILNDIKIKSSDNNTFGVDVANYFCYGKLYKFRVEKVITNPIHLRITSNIKPFIYNKNKIINVDLQNQKQIQLAIHSHNGYYQNNKPEQMLKSDDSAYYTKNNAINGSWIIFAKTQNEYYHPTKVELRGWNGRGSAKEFNLFVGNSDNNVWLKCNNAVLTAEMKNGWQSFKLDICHHNNMENEINEKWHTMQKNQYSQYKLEILSGHGSTIAGFREFKIFGVECRQ